MIAEKSADRKEYELDDNSAFGFGRDMLFPRELEQFPKKGRTKWVV
jgi:hypothetical protein